MQSSSRRRKPHHPRHSPGTTRTSEDTLLLLALSLDLRLRARRLILINRLVLDLLSLARRLGLPSRRLAVDSSLSSSALLRGRSLGSLSLRGAVGGDVADRGGDFLLDLGPGVGGGDRVRHAGEGGEFLVVGLWGSGVSHFSFRGCDRRMLSDAYFGFLAEAEPGESHELALAVGEGVLGVVDGCHAGTN